MPRLPGEISRDAIIKGSLHSAALYFYGLCSIRRYNLACVPINNWEGPVKPIQWTGGRLRLLDQTALPLQEIYIEISDYRETISAIKTLKVRGAPAIGIAAAYGIVLGAQSVRAASIQAFKTQLERILQDFAGSRPTAVNLFWTINRMRQAVSMVRSVDEARIALAGTARLIHRQQARAMASLSRAGSSLIGDGFTVLTHCNTGQLATGVEYGTALGIIKAAAEQGKKVRVFADETRPLLQGARLTTWELERLKIPVTLITDSMAGHFIHLSKIDCVMVGADRIAANGDTANKIGTYSVAVLARENRVPFYVAAPLSSIDISIDSGDQIPIEERGQEEVLTFNGLRIAPHKVRAANPAFDVTPHKYVSAVITENGIIRPPYKRNIKSALQEVQ
jgi:methylthioribose-1-phosphate isomerase